MKHILSLLRPIRTATGTLLLAAAALQPLPAAADGPEIQDFNFYNTDLHLVLKALAEITSVTFVEDVPLTGKVTIHVVKRTGLDEVLETILKPLGLSVRIVGNVYHIGYKSGQIEARDKPGYVQKEYVLKYAAAGETARRLRKFLRARGIVSVDRGMNKVTVTMPNPLVAEVDNLVKAIDVEEGRKLISIRVKLLEIVKSGSKESNATFDYAKHNAALGVSSQFADILQNGRGYQNGAGGEWGGRGNIDEYNAQYQDALTFKTGFYGITQTVVRLKLTESTDEIKTVSEPDVVVLEGQKAIVKIGQKVPLPTSDYKDVGVDLTITPQLAKEGLITLEVNAMLSELSQGAFATFASGVSSLDSREVSTKLTLVNGDTGRLGGLLRQEEQSRILKIPILGDIPLLGFFFRDSRPSTVRRELVVLISPSIVEDVPPHGRRTPGINALVAWMIPGTTNVVLDWSEDVPVDNVGVFQYRVYRDTRPILSTARLAPIADAIPRAASSWVDEGPKRRGVTFYYAVTAVDGAGNAQAVSNSPAITVPRR